MPKAQRARVTESCYKPAAAVLRPRLFVLAAALLWSTAGAGVKLCALNAMQIACGRSLIAAIVLFLALKEVRQTRITKPILMVAAAYAATVVLFVVATKETTAANAIFLQDTAPLWVLVLSPWLLKEKPTRSELIAVPIFLVGLTMFFIDQLKPSQYLGNLVAIGSGFAFALCIMGLRHIKASGITATAWGNVIAAGITLPFIFTGPSPNGVDISVLLFLGIFQLGLAYALFSKGVSQMPAVEASLLILIEPVLNPIWTYLFKGEEPGRWAIAGGAVILAASIWRTLTPLFAGAKKAAA